MDNIVRSNFIIRSNYGSRLRQTIKQTLKVVPSPDEDLRQLVFRQRGRQLVPKLVAMDCDKVLRCNNRRRHEEVVKGVVSNNNLAGKVDAERLELHAKLVLKRDLDLRAVDDRARPRRANAKVVEHDQGENIEKPRISNATTPVVEQCTKDRDESPTRRSIRQILVGKTVSPIHNRLRTVVDLRAIARSNLARVELGAELLATVGVSDLDEPLEGLVSASRHKGDNRSVAALEMRATCAVNGRHVAATNNIVDVDVGVLEQSLVENVGNLRTTLGQQLGRIPECLEQSSEALVAAENLERHRNLHAVKHSQKATEEHRHLEGKELAAPDVRNIWEDTKGHDVITEELLGAANCFLKAHHMTRVEDWRARRAVVE